MSFINYMAREINCKIVYYGPGLCGKTTNLQHIYERTNPDAKGKMISLATETERTLFFDFLPLSLGEIRGFKTRFHLYTVPGQVFYDASRKLILKGVDGVIFVADSQFERLEANQESMDNLRENMAEQGYDLDKVPFVIQYNKRDLPNVVDLDELRQELNPRGVPRVARRPALWAARFGAPVRASSRLAAGGVYCWQLRPRHRPLAWPRRGSARLRPGR
jgi:signal recognition particle receptor subunit beta